MAPKGWPDESRLALVCLEYLPFPLRQSLRGNLENAGRDIPDKTEMPCIPVPLQLDFPVKAAYFHIQC
ncbi:hypothetical protein AY555_03155 [Haematospirillum jordaniae]|uniref:Uncharacterized protein n=1 Tax=Haematospirillum jordaniae TaxID=1549855 RepID=A0A143DDZ8_9PROT|nr:hypothetical protein AY555_03155 [Haematospirillum jordaniae]